MSKRSVVFMFSGQGSQYYQMGRAFFNANAAFRSILLELNTVAIPLLGRSIVDVLYTDGRRKDEIFDDIKLTSAAIFLVEYALAKTLMDDGIKPDFLLTSSMGIYAAAAIAEAIDPREVLESLAKLATIWEARCQKGSMITVLSTHTLHQDLNALREKSDIAAVNFDSHFVISTSNEHLDEVSAALLRENVAFQKVAVSYPFHSRWIDGARDAALEVLGTMRYRRPTIPLVCCAHASVLEAVAPESIWHSLRKPIEFKRTIAELEKRGPYDYVDVGPAGTLVTMLKYALPPGSASRGHAILSPFSQELTNYQRLTLRGGPFGTLSQDASHRNLRG
jgi:acyl transferase domain-containing protein